MRGLLIFGIAAMASLPLLAQKTYYISMSGNNANNGLSPATAWRDPQRANAKTFGPGDSILIERGGVFEGQIANTFQGTPSHPIVIGAYGSGPKPILYGDLRGRTWKAIPGRPGYYQMYLGGPSLLLTGYRQWVNGAWKHSLVNGDGYNGLRGSDPSSWSAWLNQMPEGSIGTNVEHDTLFIRTYGNISISTNVTRDSIRVYRYGNNIGVNSHDVIMRDLDARYYFNPIVASGGDFGWDDNVIVRACETRYGTSGGIRLIRCMNSVADSCVVDTSGDTGMYLVSSYRTAFRNNLIKHVFYTIDGGIDDGNDRCGIGILDNYAWGRTQDTVGYNTVEYNTLYYIYDSFTDWYFSLGDTVRYNTGHEAGGGGSPHGSNLVMTNNTFTFFSSGGGAGTNIAQLGGGDITYAYNTLDSITSYGIWVAGNDNGTITVHHNTIRIVIPARTFVDYKTITGITSTDNYFVGLNDLWGAKGTTYTTLTSFQAATGYEVGSKWSSTALAPAGVLQLMVDDTARTRTALPVGGGQVILAWSSTNAMSATITPGIGSVPTSGTDTVMVQATTTFTLTVTGSFGSTQSSVFVQVADSSISVVPTSFILQQNYPNPFNGGTIIVFNVAEDRTGSVKVFDMLGREVATIAQGLLTKGTHIVRWEAAGLASGVYYCRFTAGSQTETRAMVLLR